MDCLDGAWEGDAVISGRSWLDAVLRKTVRESRSERFEGSCMLIDLIRSCPLIVKDFAGVYNSRS